MRPAEGTDALSVREGRARYFEAWGLGEGGYAARWVRLRVFGLPVGFPNSAGRVRAVKLHDLHHVATGYAADWIGEAEIGAWEVGAGCHGHAAAWILNLLAMQYGFFLAPRRVLRAMARGRRSRTLYRMRELDESLLDRTVGELRRELGLDGEPPEPRVADMLALAAWMAASAALWLGPGALLLGLRAALA